MVLFSFLVSLVSLIMLPFTWWFCGFFRFHKPNYKGELIPSIFGLYFVLVFLISSFFIFPLFEAASDEFGGGFRLSPIYLPVPIVCLVFVPIFGLLDDLFGSREVRGLKGHFQALAFQRKLTSGILKALGISASGLIMGFAHRGVTAEGVMDAFVMSLTANALNLLDVRPGRAIKVFALMAILVFTLGGLSVRVPLMPLIIASVFYAPLDFRSKAMLGDIGANFLGFILGLSMALSFSIWAKSIVLLGLVALHIYTEKFSLSETVERLSVLRFLDHLGVKR